MSYLAKAFEQSSESELIDVVGEEEEITEEARELMMVDLSSTD